MMFRVTLSSSPEKLLSFCLGHEGKGSVLALLKIKGWAQELSAGFSYSLNEFAVFKCTIKLTDAGVQRWEDAVALVLDYLRTMRNAEEDKLRQLYDEQTAIDSADFQFQSRQTEETYADKLSNALLLYPADLVLCARNCCVEPIFDYGVFKQLLEYFNCGNMRVHVTAPLSQQPDPHLPWLRAPWYGTQYRVSSLIDSFELCLGAKLATDNDLQAALEARGHSIAQGLLALPPPNPYVVSCIDILGDKQSTPSIVLSCSRGVAWHCPVPELREPRVTVFVHLSVPWACESAATFIALRCILEVLDQRLTSETYLASEAGLESSVSNTALYPVSGIRITINGFHDKMHVLVDAFAAVLCRMSMTQEELDFALEIFKAGYQKRKFEGPHTLALRALDHVIESPRLTDEAKLEVLSSMTLQFVHETFQRFIRDAFVTSLSCGSVTSDMSASVCRIFIEQLHSALSASNDASSTPAPSPLSLPSCGAGVFVPEDCWAIRYPPAGFRVCTVLNAKQEMNSCIVFEYETGPAGAAFPLEAEANIALEVVSEFLHNYIYDRLRTQSQLGYIVQAWCSRKHGIGRVRVLVQSQLDEKHVESEMLKAMEGFIEHFDSISDESIRQFLVSFAEQELQPDLNVRKAADRVAFQAFANHRRWNRKREVADHAQAYSPSHSRAFARRYLSAESNQRRIAVVCAYAQCRAPAFCRPGEVLVEWEGAPPRQLLEVASGLDNWGNTYRVA